MKLWSGPERKSMTKLACLDAVQHGFPLGKYLESKAKAAIENPEGRTRRSVIFGGPGTDRGL
jgi:hypothetical protein